MDRRQRRVGAMLISVVALCLSAIGTRLAYINVEMRPRLERVSRAQREGHTILPARRGTIFDCRGRIVALSRQTPDVFVDPSRVTDIEGFVRTIAPRINVTPVEIIRKMQRHPGSRFVILASRVDPITASAVRELNHRATGLTDQIQRVYPLGDSMAQLLGWVGRDGHGLEGVELTFDQHLAGEDGRRDMIHDAARRALRRSPTERAASDLPQDGGHLVLTIDAEIQRITERALAEGVERFESEGGVAVMLAPATGDILAMASYPAFDANAPNMKSTLSFRRNRIVTDPVEPGSTFKPFIICGALAGGFVTTDEKIDCQMGSHYFGNRLIKDTRPHGLMDIRGIIAKSSNIGMGMIAHRMGNKVLHDTVRSFGFGVKTGIAVPGEDRGLVRPLAKWNSYSTNSVAIGYEILVTPLQLATAFAAIVNDGVLLKPRLVRRMLSSDGVVLQSYDSPEIVRRVVSSEIARYVAEDLLVAVVEDGGGHRARIGPHRVLGKTGTPKLTFSDRPGYQDGEYLGLFVGAAPVVNPRLVVVVVVRRPNPDLGYYGGTVAAPIAGEIIDATLTYLEVPVDRDPDRLRL